MAEATAKKGLFRKVITKIKSDNERGSRMSVIEELFYDFNRSKSQVYWMNFIRGLFFGAGSVIGGTVVIALLVWILSLLAHIIPPLGQFFDGIGHMLQSGKR